MKLMLVIIWHTWFGFALIYNGRGEDLFAFGRKLGNFNI